MKVKFVSSIGLSGGVIFEAYERNMELTYLPEVGDAIRIGGTKSNGSLVEVLYRTYVLVGDCWEITLAPIGREDKGSIEDMRSRFKESGFVHNELL